MSSSVVPGCSTPIDGERKVSSGNTAISSIHGASSEANVRGKLVFPGKKTKLRKRKVKKVAARKIVRSENRGILSNPHLVVTSDSQTDEPSRIIEASRKILRRKKCVVPKDSDLGASSDSQTDEPYRIFKSKSSILSQTSRKRWHSTIANTTAESVLNDPELINHSEEEPRLKRHTTNGIRCYPPASRPSKPFNILKPSYYNNSTNTKFGPGPTISDMLWDDFVRKNPNTVGKYLEDVRNRLLKRKFFKTRLSVRHSEQTIQQSKRSANDQQREAEGRQTKVAHKRPKTHATIIIHGSSTRESPTFTTVYGVHTTQRE